MYQKNQNESKKLKEQLEKLVNSIKNRGGKAVNNDLGDLLEAQEEFAKSSNSYAKKQLAKVKK